MKILIIMGGFFPGQKYGGPPVSVNNFCSLFRENECYIVTKNHDKDESVPYEGIDTGIWIKRDNCYVKYVSDENYKKSEFEKVILEIKPDILYLQGLFQSCVLPCLELAKQYSLKVMLAPRGELCAGAFKKKYKKIPYIIFLKLFGLLKNIYFQSTSDEETKAIKQYLSAKDNRVYMLSNVPSIPSNKELEVNKKSGQAKFIFLSRIVPKKNLLAALNYMSNIKGSVEFDVYGALEDESYWEECKRQIARLPKNIKVEYKGLVNHDQVHDTFRKYDAFIFPTFSENFGHVIAEALMVGCPIIISNQTPWNDVADVKGGWSIPLEESEQYIQAIQEIVNADEDEEILFRKNILNYIEGKMNLKALQENYAECFSKMISENNK